MAKPCPTPVDVTDLQFKLQCRLKVFNNRDVSAFPNLNSLTTCASRYGLLFVGTNLNEFQVIQTNTLLKYSPKDKDVANYARRNIQLPSPPQHLIVNCDNTILAVVVEKDQCSTVIFYSVLSFLSQNVKIVREVRLSATPGVQIREVNWNPSLPDIFTACKSDNSLGVYELKGDSVDINELPAAAGATCFCWSPKGKQIAVGSKDGKITQYKPDLKAVKAIPAPKLNGSLTIISLQWVSNYQFIGVYQTVPNGTCCIIVVDAPKTGEPVYTNYDDICYSILVRPAQYFMISQQTWNFLMVASANSTEVGVLGYNGESWIQWITSDTARAELPLSEDHQETLPVGLTFDISPTNPLPWGESTIPPCPLLCILSHQGVLCVFNVVYLKEGAPSVCTPPDPITDLSGLSMFVAAAPTSTPSKEAVTIEATTAPSMLIQSTPIVTKGAEASLKNLFGGQATVTPIKPQQGASGIAPGAVLFGGQTSILPVDKPGAASPQSSSFPEKYSSIFSALNPTATMATSSTAPVKPIVVSAVPKPETTQSVSSIKNPQIQPSQVRGATISAAPHPQSATTTTTKKPDLALINRLIADERISLNEEISQLIKMGRSLQLNVGTDEEMVKLIEQIEALQEFVKDAVEISQGQSSEIHCLKQNLIQSWAWFEEAKSHYNASKNEVVNLLIKVQSLDSLSEKRLKDIQQLAYYIDSQISLGNKVLDEQWENFQDYAKKRYKVKMPTMEAIFQTMVKQNAVLQKEAYVLKTISMRLKKKTSKIGSLLMTLEKDRDLVEDFQNLHLSPEDLLQLQVDKVKSLSKKLSEVKVKKLQQLLKERPVTRITAVKPQVSSWTLKQSPSESRVRNSLNKLNASVVRNLDFGEQSGAAAAEEPAKSSIPPAFKTGLTSSQGSAFAPLMQGFKPQDFKTSVSAPFANLASTTATSSPSFNVTNTAFSAAGPSAVQVTNATTSINTNIAGKCLKLTESGGDQQTNTSAAPSNVISVSLFGNQETPSAEPAFSATGMTFKNIFSAAQTGIATTLQQGSGKPVSSPAVSASSSFFSGNVDASKQFTNSSFSFATAPVNLQTAKVSSAPSSAPSTSSAFSSSVFNTGKTASAVGSSSAPSFFGISKLTSSSASSSQASFFAPKATTATVAGSTVVSSAQSSEASVTPPMFGTSPVVPAITDTNIFGSKTPSSASSESQPLAGTVQTPAAPPFGTSGSTASSGQATSAYSAPEGHSAKVSASQPLPEGSKSGSSSIFSTPASTAVSAQSLFGNSNLSVSIFSSPTVKAPSTAPENIFTSKGQQQPLSTTSTAVSPATETSSVTSTDATASAAKSTPSSAFSTSTASTENNIFAAKVVSPTPTFEPPKSSSLFASPSSAAAAPAEPAFGAATSTFGSDASKKDSASSLTTSSIFGGQPFASTTSVFGTPTPPSAGFVSSPFGGGAAPFGNPMPASATGSFFGGSAVVSSTGSIFGGASNAGSVFSAPATTVTTFSQSPGFGATPAFGAAPAVTTSAPPAFGATPAFGAAPAVTTSAPPAFGTFPATTTAPGGNIFGSPSAVGSTFGTGFGATTTTGTTSVFGSPPVTTAQQQTSGAFGFGGLSVGGGGTSSGNIFGGSSGASTFGQQANPFGKVEPKPSAFGSSATNIFGSPTPVTTSSGGNIFGSPSTVAPASSTPAFGQPPAFGSASPFGGASSAFGQKPAFGQAAPFNQSSSFGSPQAGPFSGGGGAAPVAQSGFGASPSFQKPGFGAAPVFGGSSGFGSPPSFGGAPSFGAAPVFGTPQKVFGSPGQAPTTGGFGAAAAQPSAGFGNLASQNTIGFGNLAQQANSTNSMPFAGSSSFTSWR